MPLPRCRFRLVSLLMLASLSLAGCGSSATAPTPPAPRTHKLGDKGYLSGGKENTLVAVDEKSLQEAAKALAAKDDTGMYELMLSRRVIALPNDTKVLVIDLNCAGRSDGIHIWRISPGSKATMGSALPRKSPFFSFLLH
jgi:hypothetical protein